MIKKMSSIILAAACAILPVATVSCVTDCKSPEQKPAAGTKTDKDSDKNVSGEVSSDKICAAYIATWGVYDSVKNKHRAWTTSDIDGTKLTDLILSFAELDDTDHVTLLTEEVEDYYGEVSALVKKYPHLRVSVAIGGGSEGVADFKAMSSDKELRAKFVGNVKKLLENNTNIRGIDIDWEYPGQRLKAGSGAWKTEFNNYLSLLSELKTMMTELGSKNGNSYRLTTALPADVKSITDNVAEIQKVCDGLNLMMYDYYGAWSRTTGHNAPLNEIEDSLNRFLEAGASPDKLVLGIPFYGQKWTEVEEGDNHGLGSSVTPNKNGYDYGIQYPEIVKLLKNSNYKKYWDDDAKAPYAYSAKDKVFISYTDEKQIGFATQLVRENKLSGVMTWEYGQDMSKTLLNAMYKGVSK